MKKLRDIVSDFINKPRFKRKATQKPVVKKPTTYPKDWSKWANTKHDDSNAEAERQRQQFITGQH